MIGACKALDYIFITGNSVVKFLNIISLHRQLTREVETNLILCNSNALKKKKILIKDIHLLSDQHQ